MLVYIVFLSIVVFYCSTQRSKRSFRVSDYRKPGELAASNPKFTRRTRGSKMLVTIHRRMNSEDPGLICIHPGKWGSYRVVTLYEHPL